MVSHADAQRMFWIRPSGCCLSGCVRKQAISDSQHGEQIEQEWKNARNLKDSQETSASGEKDPLDAQHDPTTSM
jgi:hypothetical protein